MNEEYQKYHSSKKMKTERAQRNKNRRQFEKAGKVKKGDGKAVDHKSSARTGSGLNNAKSNLRVISAKANRIKQ